MTSIRAWLLVTGTGALLGWNPAAGWMFAAAATSMHALERRQALGALIPIVIGHAQCCANRQVTPVWRFAPSSGPLPTEPA